MRILLRSTTTPLGPMLLGASEAGIVLCEFADRGGEDRIVARLVKRHRCEVSPAGVWPPEEHSSPPHSPHLDLLEEQLDEYFAGSRREFDIPLDLGGTPWQRRVWAALLMIPFGVTRSYGALANDLGKPGGSRAVGRANGDNYVAIVIPCHRVVQSDGGLRGYGGGLHRKRWLLDWEAGTQQLSL